jgi:hypothetical protein
MWYKGFMSPTDGITIDATTSFPNLDFRPPDYAHIVGTLMPLDA